MRQFVAVVSDFKGQGEAFALTPIYGHTSRQMHVVSTAIMSVEAGKTYLFGEVRLADSEEYGPQYRITVLAPVDAMTLIMQSSALKSTFGAPKLSVQPEPNAAAAEADETDDEAEAEAAAIAEAKAARKAALAAKAKIPTKA